MVVIRKYALLLPAQLAKMELGRHGIESVILDDHIATCVNYALTGSNVDDRREKVEELVAVLGGRKK